MLEKILKARNRKEKLTELDWIKIEDSHSLWETGKRINRKTTREKNICKSHTWLTMDLYYIYIYMKASQILIIIIIIIEEDWNNVQKIWTILNKRRYTDDKHMKICLKLLANHLPIPMATEKKGEEREGE